MHLSSLWGRALKCGIRRSIKAALLACCILAIGACSVAAEELPRLSLGYSLKSIVDIDAKDAHAAIKLWATEMGEQAHVRTTSLLYADVRALASDFQKGSVDIAVFAPLDYIKIEQTLKGNPAFIGVRNGKTTERYVLLTAVDRSGNDIMSLKGRRIAFVQNDAMAHLFLNTLLLRQRQPEMDRFFAATQIKAKPSQAIHAVYFGAADACVTSERAYQTMVELNPQVGKKLKAIALSPGLLQGVSVYRGGLSQDLKQKAEAFGRLIKTYPRGKQMLTLFQIDDIVVVQEADFAATRQLYREYRQLKGRLL